MALNDTVLNSFSNTDEVKVDEFPKIIGKFQIEELLSLVLVTLEGIKKTNEDNEKRIYAIKALIPIIEKMLIEIKEAEQVIVTASE